MNESQRVAWWQNLAQRYPWLQQFGQGNDARSFYGRTGCGFTVLQTLALGWRNRTYTHNQIAALVGYPTPAQLVTQTGLNWAQVEAFIKKADLPYVIVPRLSSAREWTYGEVMRRANLYGPVAFGLRYGDQPEWYGKTYLGVKADGKPNGYASPKGHAGKTQLTGFEDGSHLDLLLGYHVIRNVDGSVNRRVCHVKDPNHGSPIRPERPPYDDVTDTQFKRMYEGYHALGRRLYAIVPTEVFTR